MWFRSSFYRPSTDSLARVWWRQRERRCSHPSTTHARRRSRTPIDRWSCVKSSFEAQTQCVANQHRATNKRNQNQNKTNNTNRIQPTASLPEAEKRGRRHGNGTLLLELSKVDVEDRRFKNSIPVHARCNFPPKIVHICFMKPHLYPTTNICYSSHLHAPGHATTTESHTYLFIVYHVQM